MTRPTKPNPTPRSPFNLRITGPMKPGDIYKRLGQGFRVAHSHGDQKATVDADPCPHCGALVEWAPTTHSYRGRVESFVYARCQGRAKHSWGLSSREVKEAGKTPPKPIPPPRPSAGALVMSQWIEKRVTDLQAQVQALAEMKKLMEVIVPHPLASPQLPIPPNGDPTPPHRG